MLQKAKKVVPVATFVLYFGTDKRWNKKHSLKELFKIPQGMEPYVSDYKINVVEVAWLTDEQLRMFKSDFGIVAHFFVQKRRNKNYVPDDNRTIQHVDEVLKLLSVVTGDRKYESILYNEKQERANSMCEVAERLVNSGIAQGTEIGKEIGKAEGESMLATLITRLISEGRDEDIKRVVENKEVRESFYKEFGII